MTKLLENELQAEDQPFLSITLSPNELKDLQVFIANKTQAGETVPSIVFDIWTMDPVQAVVNS